MIKELKKRITTSIILFIAIIFCILIHSWVFIFVISLILFICFMEWRQINVQFFHVENPNKFWGYFLTCGIVHCVHFAEIWARGWLGRVRGGSFSVLSVVFLNPETGAGWATVLLDGRKIFGTFNLRIMPLQ